MNLDSLIFKRDRSRAACLTLRLLPVVAVEEFVRSNAGPMKRQGRLRPDLEPEPETEPDLDLEVELEPQKWYDHWEPELDVEQQMASQLCGICGCDAATARQHLEAAGWDVQAAVESYFAAPQEPQPEPQPAPAPAPAPALAAADSPVPYSPPR